MTLAVLSDIMGYMRGGGKKKWVIEKLIWVDMRGEGSKRANSC